MNDKWINDLEKKMKDHTEIGPEGLWEDLEQKLFGEEKGKVIPLWSDTVQQAAKAKKASRNIRIKRLVGVVASVVIVGLVAVELTKKEGGEILLQEKEVDVRRREHIVDFENVKLKQEEARTSKGIVEEKRNKKDARSTSLSRALPSEKRLLTDQREEATAVVIATEHVTPIMINQNKASLLEGVDKEEVREQLTALLEQKKEEIERGIVIQEVQATREETASKEKRGFSIGILSGNLSSTSNVQETGFNSINGAFKLGTKVPEFGIAEAVLSEIYIANKNKVVYTDVKHKKPIRFGVALYYPIGDKWGLNTGVTYTKLSSELTSGSEVYKIMSDQTLHYVGIPIQANYSVWEKGNFSTYVNGGFHFEKSVYGKLKTKYQAEERIENRASERLKVKGIQTSVNLGIGMEYKLGRGIGLFLEPGARYHFDSGSDIETIYTDRPFNFNVQVGFRYSIGNKKSNKE